MAGHQGASGGDGGDDGLSRRALLRRAGLTAAAAPIAGLAACSPGADPATGVDAGTAGTEPGAATADTMRSAMAPGFMELPPVRLPAPGTGNGMNVLIVVLDSLRRDHVGAYGATHVDTPAIDGLARTSTRFDQARPEGMPTVQVRRCIHTGQRTFPVRGYWPQKGVRVRMPGWQRIPEEQVTLAEILDAAGYYTALITDVPHLFDPSMNFHRGFNYWNLVPGQDNGRFVGGGADVREREQDHQAPRVFSTAAGMLGAAVQRRPFLMVVDCYDPHEPWDPPVDWIARYGEPSFDGDEPVRPSYGIASEQLAPHELDRVNVLYRAEVAMTDAWLGRFLDDADDRGLLDDTLVVLLSDHGVLLGEHDLIGKPVTRSLWPEITDIPLLIHHPDDRAARVDARMVSTHDVVPTVLSALDIPPAQALPGIDLTPVLTGSPDDAAARDHLTMGYAAAAQIRTADWTLVMDPDRSNQELFDVRVDPGMTRDLAQQRPDVAERLVAQLEQDAGGPLPIHDGPAVLERLGPRET